MKRNLEKLVNPALFVVGAALLRLVPHLPNFAPIGAMALFGGTYMNKKWAIALPLAAMFASDIFIGFDGWTSRLTVYGSFAAIGLIGIWLRKHKSPVNMVAATLASSLLFFVVTNFGVWAFGTIYPKTIDGLLACFAAALPFFRNTVLGDAFYVTTLFGGYELAYHLVKNKKPAVVERNI